MSGRSKSLVVVCGLMLALCFGLVSGGAAKSSAATVGGTLHGVVTDAETGIGVPDVVVRVDDAGQSWVATTGPDGRYSIGGIPVDTDWGGGFDYSISAVAGSPASYYVWDATQNPLQIFFDEGQTDQELNLTGVRGGILSGALELVDGPVPAGYYAVLIDGPDYWTSVHVPFGEGFEVAVPAGSYTLSYVTSGGEEQDGYVTDGEHVARLFDPVEDQSAAIAEGSRLRVESKLSYGSSVAHVVGVVTGPDGQPVSDAIVSAYYKAANGAWDPTKWASVLPSDDDPTDKLIVLTGETRTSADGTYVLNVLGGSAYRFRAHPIAEEDLQSARGMAYQFYPNAGCAADARSVSPTSSASTIIDFALPYGTVLAGKLTDQLGRGPQGIPFFQHLDRLTAGGTWESAAGSWSWSSGYSMAPVPPGTYRLSFAAGDEGLIFKKFYYYQTSTSSKATKIPIGPVSKPTTVTLKPSKFLGTYPSSVRVSPGSSTVRRNATVKFSAGVYAGDEVRKALTISIYRSYDGHHWSFVKSAKTSSTTGKYAYSAKITRTVWYRFKYAGTSTLSSSYKTVKITAK